MTEFIATAMTERVLGLAPHYPLLHAAVLGLDAQRTLEFGAGGSTRVITDALRHTGGTHWSVSTEKLGDISVRYGVEYPSWNHFCGLSDDFTVPDEWFDIILHDGSHTFEVVRRDIERTWGCLRIYGLLFVHDTQHSSVGRDVIAGLRDGLDLNDANCSHVTLPYGFGFTIVRKEADDIRCPHVLSANTKPSSLHTTKPFRVAL